MSNRRTGLGPPPDLKLIPITYSPEERRKKLARLHELLNTNAVGSSHAARSKQKPSTKLVVTQTRPEDIKTYKQQTLDSSTARSSAKKRSYDESNSSLHPSQYLPPVVLAGLLGDREFVKQNMEQEKKSKPPPSTKPKPNILQHSLTHSNPSHVQSTPRTQMRTTRPAQRPASAKIIEDDISNTRDVSPSYEPTSRKVLVSQQAHPSPRSSSLQSQTRLPPPAPPHPHPKHIPHKHKLHKPSHHLEKPESEADEDDIDEEEEEGDLDGFIDDRPIRSSLAEYLPQSMSSFDKSLDMIRRTGSSGAVVGLIRQMYGMPQNLSDLPSGEAEEADSKTMNEEHRYSIHRAKLDEQAERARSTST